MLLRNLLLHPRLTGLVSRMGVYLAHCAAQAPLKPRAADQGTWSIGRHSYGLSAASIMATERPCDLSIGNFCSFAPDVRILLNVDHPTNLASTFPFRSKLPVKPGMLAPGDAPNRDAISKGAVSIGHDVWVGAGAMILSGVSIGTGAIIGAGAVVAKDVPPYAIMVGNPARLLRHRFEALIIERLLQSRWWDLPDAAIAALDGALYSTDIERFLAEVDRLKRRTVP